MKWTKIDGKEIKPTNEDIIIRYLSPGTSKGTYFKGWYNDESEQYGIGDDFIEQDRITHYIILDEPKV